MLTKVFFLYLTTIVQNSQSIDVNTFGSYTPKDTDRIHNFSITNLKYSPVPDLFPLYFLLHFSTFNRTYSILFSYISNPDAHFTQYQSFSRTYKSVVANATKADGTQSTSSVYSANCVLILNAQTYQHLSTHSSVDRAQPGQLFHLSVHMRKKQPNSSSELWLKVELESADGIYAARRVRIHSKPSRRAKRQAKIQLTVESAVVINYQVYQVYTKLLNTKNKAYIKMFLDLSFAQIIDRVDKIWREATNQFFEIRVEFVELVIDYELIDYNLMDEVHFLRYVTQILSARKDLDFKKFDHIFLIHNFVQGISIGLAFIGQVCQFLKASSILYPKHHFIEVVMAHELGHNLGSDHDNKTSINNRWVNCYHEMKLMYPNAVLEHSSFQVSECTIEEIRKSLFHKSRLRDTFKCLVQKNYYQGKHVYLEVAKAYLPGHFFSLTEQCKYLMNSSGSFYCNGQELSCIFLYCYNEAWARCQKVNIWALDGTVCGFKKMCYRANCERVKGNKRVMGDLDRAVTKMRHNCPGGTSQESFVHNKKFKEAGFVFTKSCNVYLNEKFGHMNMAEKEALSAVCCEEFNKFYSFKCDGKEGHCDRNICREKPCYNNGKCVEVKLKGKDKFTFKCVCAKGFSGPLCLTVDPCYFEPCGYNEMCKTFGSDGSYVCLCMVDKTNHSKCEDSLMYDHGKFFFGSKDKIRKYLSLVVTSALSVFLSSFLVLQSIAVCTTNVKRVPVRR